MSDERKKALAGAAGYAVYDKRGIPIMPGDTVKVFHYTSVRREKRYMYKYAGQVVWRASEKRPLLQFIHRNLREEWFLQIMDGRTLSDYEIVQGYEGVPLGHDYRDRKRHTPKLCDRRGRKGGQNGH